MDNYVSISQALVLLFKPLVEVVIHDIKSNKIIFIDGVLSKRKIGEDSLLDIAEGKLSNVSDIIYPKINFDGKLIKSISIPIHENNACKYLMCINCDVSIFNQMHGFMEEFLLHTNDKNKPSSLFKNDWQEKVHIAIHNYIEQKKWNFDNLNNSHKKEIVYQLIAQGAFSEKNAADYIADILNMGRATIFNYLKQWRKENANENE